MQSSRTVRATLVLENKNKQKNQTSPFIHVVNPGLSFHFSERWGEHGRKKWALVLIFLPPPRGGVFSNLASSLQKKAAGEMAQPQIYGRGNRLLKMLCLAEGGSMVGVPTLNFRSIKQLNITTDQLITLGLAS